MAPAPAVATVRQGSLSAPAPVAAIVQQQGIPFDAYPYRAYRGRASDYFIVIKDFYKFYKTIDPEAATDFFKEISGRLYARWEVLIAPKDHFISTVYWNFQAGAQNLGCLLRRVIH